MPDLSGSRVQGQPGIYSEILSRRRMGIRMRKRRRRRRKRRRRRFLTQVAYLYEHTGLGWGKNEGHLETLSWEARGTFLFLKHKGSMSHWKVPQ
jgi:hypothetical protein